jgi:hypothetical protein
MASPESLSNIGTRQKRRDSSIVFVYLRIDLLQVFLCERRKRFLIDVIFDLTKTDLLPDALVSTHMLHISFSWQYKAVTMLIKFGRSLYALWCADIEQ